MAAIETILADCGVTNETITQRHRDELDELGFTVFHNLIDPAWLEEMRSAFERPTFPKDEMTDLQATHPQETYITGPAGSVAFFNGQIWHGSTTNRTNQMRRVYHCAFTARENPQQTDQRAYLRAETEKRLSPAARYILDL